MNEGIKSWMAAGGNAAPLPGPAGLPSFRSMDSGTGAGPGGGGPDGSFAVGGGAVVRRWVGGAVVEVVLGAVERWGWVR